VLEQKKTQNGWRVAIKVDGSVSIAVDEDKEWHDDANSFGGHEFSTSEQLNPDQPIVLFCRRFARQSPSLDVEIPVGAGEGILLWIEPVAKPVAAP
jgi:hypothetical protein